MIIPKEAINRGCASGSRRETKKVTTFGEQINFTKMVASGNDFVVIDSRRPLNHLGRALPLLAKKICDRKHGVGADGLLLLESSRKTDVKMRIFNPDGSEPKMCGNGVRCIALYAARNKTNIKTKAGIIEARVNKAKDDVNPVRKKSLKRGGLSNGVKIKMTSPSDIKLDLPITIAKRGIKVNFINTGVPHTVIFTEGVDSIDVVGIGRQVRFYKRFLPAGTNVDFVQVIDDNNIKLRTYERGVEDETLACGTGAVAAALISAIHYPPAVAKVCLRQDFGRYPTKLEERSRTLAGCPPKLQRRRTLPTIRKINVHTRGKEILRVEFNRINNKFKDVWLEGKARSVYSGVYYV